MQEEEPNVWQQANLAITLLIEGKPWWKRALIGTFWWLSVLVGYVAYQIEQHPKEFIASLIALSVMVAVLYLTYSH